MQQIIEEFIFMSEITDGMLCTFRDIECGIILMGELVHICLRDTNPCNHKNPRTSHRDQIDQSDVNDRVKNPTGYHLNMF